MKKVMRIIDLLFALIFTGYAIYNPTFFSLIGAGVSWVLFAWNPSKRLPNYLMQALIPGRRVRS